MLCDRFADSTVAYQGYGREQNIEELKRLISFATGGLSPDLTLYLDLPPEEGIRRKLADYQNRLDVQGLSFYRRVEAGYREMIAQEPQRWVVINAGRSLEEVHQEVVRAVQDKLTARRAQPLTVISGPLISGPLPRLQTRARARPSPSAARR